MDQRGQLVCCVCIFTRKHCFILQDSYNWLAKIIIKDLLHLPLRTEIEMDVDILV